MRTRTRTRISTGTRNTHAPHAHAPHVHAPHAHAHIHTRSSFPYTKTMHFSVSVNLYATFIYKSYCHVFDETYPLVVIGSNVALGGTAKQSTTVRGPHNSADLAIDGDFKSCAATEIQSFPWWTVQLSTHFVVHEVIVSTGAIRHGKLCIYDIVEYA